MCITIILFLNGSYYIYSTAPHFYEANSYMHLERLYVSMWMKLTSKEVIPHISYHKVTTKMSSQEQVHVM